MSVASPRPTPPGCTASSAILVGPGVRADASARKVIGAEGAADLRYYSVIYDLLDEVKQAMAACWPPYRQEIIGLAEVRSVFRRRFGAVMASGAVTEGVVKRSNRIRVLRDNVVISMKAAGIPASLRMTSTKSRNGYECGIAVKKLQRRCVSDQIPVEIQRTL